MAEKQYMAIKLETSNIIKQCESLQEKIDNISLGETSKEFNRLSYDIKSLAHSNIVDEQIYLKDKLNECLNILSYLHLKILNLDIDISLSYLSKKK